ncbi:MAG: ABC transporter permease subunit [Marivivens sp.]|jgi:His/Glu/Gln/Arg/opine family amino acid ABC transporter permease subunit|uniref:ABC transporter permease n=1 Tax=Marivivens sp. TaxID=1978374 RepID=UPI0017E3001D|nr:ABC transporter permease subunit [Marivivens sp.]MCL7405134.1 ABC transporter permease subunit [Marivivens geojensis]NBQ49160.1 ABC transporter permease subunit [Marivivens sp.]NBT51636.1 ABC transporter permease subunit [Marivivens sp.]NBX08339.1 ABC transporter permease subunit [Marivivens sp.]NCW67659.1 ABC transporter permease subunit [Marivivens sp.]
MTCWDILSDYGLRSLGFGERLLPRDNFTICQQVVLIGSGMIWNIYFGLLALVSGFFLAVATAVGKSHHNPMFRKPAEWFIFVFRGSPLFIQFFFAYFTFQSLKGAYPIFTPLTSAWLGALIVLFLNTAAYSAEIFYGALMSIPKGDIEAADAYGMSGWKRFRRITFPTMLRLAWPAYTNEAIFLFHATTLVFMSGFPARSQMGDALYYASYFADKTFNPFIPYPILAGFFILLTLTVIGTFGLINKQLNRHLPQTNRAKIRLRLNLIR